ncbi:hypothetical protein CK215_29750 [Mesorhizobium sp. WSM3864]|nr:hypothetical protein CK215_29750 [Mesorhizobium sp. WSM3864]
MPEFNSPMIRVGLGQANPTKAIMGLIKLGQVGAASMAVPSWFAGVVLVIANDERFATSDHAKAGAKYLLRLVEE